MEIKIILGLQFQTSIYNFWAKQYEVQIVITKKIMSPPHLSSYPWHFLETIYSTYLVANGIIARD